MLYKPSSRKAARCYKGTKLRHHWPENEEGYTAGFYEAEVIDVPQEPVEGDEGGIYLTLQYEDQEPGNQSAWQDIEWADFGNTEECQISWLPAAAKRHQTEQRRIAKDKGKQRAIDPASGPRAVDEHEILLSDDNGLTSAKRRPTPAGFDTKAPGSQIAKKQRMAIPTGAVASLRSVEHPNSRQVASDSEDTAVPLSESNRINSQSAAVASPKQLTSGKRHGWVMKGAENQATGSGDSSTHNVDHGASASQRPNGSMLQPPEHASASGAVEELEDGTEYMEGNEAPPKKKQKRIARNVFSELQSYEDVGNFPEVAAGDGKGHAGQIKRLVLENFMNHNHIVVDFKPRLNFMCGQNGSGKTAVLHGLQICLGVSVKQSGRANTGGEFIKDNANHAKTMATLWNTGGDAYMPKRYGHEVTVVRELRRTPKNGATSSWAILNANGTKVASKKADVEDLLKALNVNAANPIVCLTQDTARGFGGNKADSERYKIYMEATQFDIIIETLKLSEVDVETMKARNKGLEKDIKAREQELKTVKQKLEHLQEVKLWEAQRNHLLNLMAWEEVEQRNGDVKLYEKALNQTLQEQTATLVTRQQEADKELKSAKEEYDLKKAAVGSFDARLADLRSEVSAQQQLYRTAKSACTSLNRELQRLRGDKTAKEDEVQATTESLQEARNQFQDEAENENDAIAAALTAKMSEAEGAEVAVQQAKQEMKAALAFAKKRHEEVIAQDSVTKAAGQRIAEVQRAMDRIRGQQSGNAISMFAAHGQGQMLARLITLINDNRNRFQKPPLGPFGSLLSLKDDKWAVAVEAAVGKTFNNFIVHSHKDAALFRNLAGRISGLNVPTLIIYDYNHAPYNFSNSRTPQVPENLPTVFRVLNVNEMEYAHVVRNVLLDQTTAERLLLVENPAEGMQAIRGELSRNRLITSAWDREGWHGVRRGNSETSIPVQGGRRIHARLRKDVAGALREAEAEIQTCQAEMSSKQQELARLKGLEREAKEAVSAAQNEVATKVTQKQQTETEIQDLQSQRETQNSSEATSVEQIEVELATLNRALNELNTQVADKEQELAAASEREATEETGMAAKRAELDAQMREYERELGDQSSSLTKVQEAELVVQQLADTAAKVQKIIQDMEVKLAAAIKERDNWTSHALQVCTKEESEESSEAMKELLLQRLEPFQRLPEEDQPQLSFVFKKWHAELERKAAAREEDVGANSLDLEAERQKHEKWLIKRSHELENLKRTYALLAQSYQDRREAARKMRKDTMNAVEISFNNYLHQRGFTGGISVNRELQQLQLEVKTGKNQTEAVTDMKSLSGGERSFTNMCFIMAVGQQISSPFHCLDEFDVFMDAINRTKAIEMLIHFGVVHEHLQLILLTPQHTGTIQDAENRVKERLKQDWPDCPDFVWKRQMHPPRP